MACATAYQCLNINTQKVLKLTAAKYPSPFINNVCWL